MGKFYPKTPKNDGRKSSYSGKVFAYKKPYNTPTSKIIEKINGANSFHITKINPLTNSPQQARTTTPNKRLLQRSALIDVFVGEPSKLEKGINFLVDKSLIDTRYSRKSPRKYNPTLQRKKEILNALPFTNNSIKDPSAIFNLEIHNLYKGTRKFDPTTINKAMKCSAGECVTFTHPKLTQETNYEWCHLIAYALGGADNEVDTPQTIDNLVAGTQECNALMISFENAVKATVKNKNFPHLTISAVAHLLPVPSAFHRYKGKYTHIAERIDYKISTPSGQYIRVVFYSTKCYGGVKPLKKYGKELANNLLHYFNTLKPTINTNRRLFPPTPHVSPTSV